MPEAKSDRQYLLRQIADPAASGDGFPAFIKGRESGRIPVFPAPVRHLRPERAAMHRYYHPTT